MYASGRVLILLVLLRKGHFVLLKWRWPIIYYLLLNIDVLQALCLKDTSEYVNPFIKINKDEFWLARNGGVSHKYGI